MLGIFWLKASQSSSQQNLLQLPSTWPRIAIRHDLSFSICTATWLDSCGLHDGIQTSSRCKVHLANIHGGVQKKFALCSSSRTQMAVMRFCSKRCLLCSEDLFLLVLLDSLKKLLSQEPLSKLTKLQWSWINPCLGVALWIPFDPSDAISAHSLSCWFGLYSLWRRCFFPGLRRCRFTPSCNCCLVKLLLAVSALMTWHFSLIGEHLSLKTCVKIQTLQHNLCLYVISAFLSLKWY